MALADLENEFVMIPLPVPLYPAVIRLIADYHAGLTHPSPAAESIAAEVSTLSKGETARSEKAWPKAAYAEVAPHLNRFSRVVLDRCSSAPGQWIGYHEVVKESGITSASARSQLGGLTKRIDRLFPKRDWRTWPFEWSVTPGSDRQLRFRMSEEEASGWREASGRAD